MLEDTNSLDGANIYVISDSFRHFAACKDNYLQHVIFKIRLFSLWLLFFFSVSDLVQTKGNYQGEKDAFIRVWTVFLHTRLCNCWTSFA